MGAEASSPIRCGPACRPSSTAFDAFERHYNQIARPFQWHFTRRDLAELIERVADHEPRLSLAA